MSTVCPLCSNTGLKPTTIRLNNKGVCWNSLFTAVWICSGVYEHTHTHRSWGNKVSKILVFSAESGAKTPFPLLLGHSLIFKRFSHSHCCCRRTQRLVQMANVVCLIFCDNFPPLVNTFAKWSGEDWPEPKLMCVKAEPSRKLNSSLIKICTFTFPCLSQQHVHRSRFH